MRAPLPGRIVWLGILVILGCEDRTTPASPNLALTDPVLHVSHAPTGGNANVFILPPLARKAAFTGPPELGLTPVVRVCESNGRPCDEGAAYGEFSMTGGTGGSVVQVIDEHYQVDWNTKQTEPGKQLTAGVVYRVWILLDEAGIGFADIRFGRRGRGSPTIGHAFVVALGQTVPFRFRLQVGVVPAAASCHELHRAGVVEDGIRTIQPSGGGPIEVFCDMSTDGGGWTLVAASAQAGTEWTWHRRSLLTTDRTTFGGLDLMDPDALTYSGNYKNIALHDIPMSDLLVRWRSAGGTVWAAYHGVGDGTESLADIIAAHPPGACEGFANGYGMTAGTFPGALHTGSTRGYCGTKLYFNLTDTNGQPAACGLGQRGRDAYGPSFNFRNNNGSCTTGSDGPFDDPAHTGFGPDRADPNTQAGATADAGNAFQLLGIGSSDRTMLLFVR